ncbi:MAG: hypothetical protein GQ474_00485 [Sulfurimonas sp.]|nr:hypothetical protein [Sulfurimonas sp.]
MAVTSTYTTAGNREDLIDVVTRVAVEETPFLSSIGKGKATGTLHEWMTEGLDAPADNAVVEGADVGTPATLTARTRLGNYCQIVRKDGLISDTQEAVMKAGIKSEYAHAVGKSTKELARDMERVLWNGTKTAGSASVARRCGGVNYWASTNRQVMSAATTVGTLGTVTSTTVFDLQTGTPAAGDHILLTDGTSQGQYAVVLSVATTTVVTLTAALDTLPTAGDAFILYDAPAALTEAVINDGLQAAKEAGGNPNAIYVSGKQKRAISGFATSQRQVIDQNKVMTATVDIYQSDFGNVQVKFDQWTPAGTAAIIDESMWRTAFLRPIVAKELAKAGSSRKYFIEGEFSLEALGENANAVVYGASL